MPPTAAKEIGGDELGITCPPDRVPQTRALTGRFFVKALGKTFGRVGARMEGMWRHSGHPQGAPLPVPQTGCHTALPLPLRDPRPSVFCRPNTYPCTRRI